MRRYTEQERYVLFHGIDGLRIAARNAQRRGSDTRVSYCYAEAAQLYRLLAEYFPGDGPEHARERESLWATADHCADQAWRLSCRGGSRTHIKASCVITCGTVLIPRRWTRTRTIIDGLE